MINEDLKNAVMGDIVLLNLIGMKVVLVHGGGPEITETLNAVGKKTEFVNGLRVTDAETAEIAMMVLAGKINKNLVNLINKFGAKALGLCGLDSQMIRAEKLDEKLGFVGKITHINEDPILDVLNMGYNAECGKEKGFGFFFHCFRVNRPYTGGCVGVPENIMKFIMQHIKPGCKITIDSLENMKGDLDS